jgi:hypothetical protein
MSSLYVDFRPIEAFEHETLGTLVIVSVHVWGEPEANYHPVRLRSSDENAQQRVARFCAEYEASYGPIPACPDGRQN